MKQSVISVIIPFYKGDDFIRCTVLSVLEQPYHNLEILLINDGSPTGGNICEELAKQDDRIRYFVKENEGIGATRNFGIDHANGEWLAFLDQDDVWVKGFLSEELVRSFPDDSDILCFSYYDCNSDLSRGTLKIAKEGKDKGRAYWRHHSSMLFGRAMLQDPDIRYALTRHEDVIFLQKAVYVAKKVAYIDRVMFLYRNNIHSESHRSEDAVQLYGPILQSWKDLLTWHKEKHPEDSDAIRSVSGLICVFAIEAVETLYKQKVDEKEAEQIVEREFCGEFLADYRKLPLGEYTKERIERYLFHRNEFKEHQLKVGRKDRIHRLVRRVPVLRKLYQRKQYHKVIPKELLGS